LSKKNDDFFNEKKPWSVIKDLLLGCYLKPYFQKILWTRRPVFYVDAFAGKGIFDDGNPGSPVIALNIISEALEKTQAKNPSIKSCLIELIHAKSLEVNVKDYENVTVIEGKYEEKIQQQLQGKESQNVFLYIDPYGVKSLHFSIFEKLASNHLHSIEMLINFNSFGFIREACNSMDVKFDIVDLEELVEIENTVKESKKKSIEDLNEVAGGSYWQDIILDYKKNNIDGYKAEIQFSNRYIEKLRGQFDYVLNMPIRLKKGQRPKYRMIHATNHPHGCILMNDNMCKRWEALQVMQNQGQISMLIEDVENNSVNKEEVQREIMKIISSKSDFVDINIFHAKFISKYGVRFPTSDICKELESLCKAGVLEVERFPKLTKKGKPSKFWTTGTDQTVKVRCAK